MNDNKTVPQSLLIAEARANLEAILSAQILSPTEKELIFKEAWLRARIMAEQEIQRDYESYKKENQPEEQEGE